MSFVIYNTSVLLKDIMHLLSSFPSIPVFFHAFSSGGFFTPVTEYKNRNILHPLSSEGRQERKDTSMRSIQFYSFFFHSANVFGGSTMPSVVTGTGL